MLLSGVEKWLKLPMFFCGILKEPPAVSIWKGAVVVWNYGYELTRPEKLQKNGCSDIAVQTVSAEKPELETTLL